MLLFITFSANILKLIFFQHIRGALGGSKFEDAVEDLCIGHLFLVGGFSESPIVQEAIRKEFKDIIKVIIPQVFQLFFKFKSCGIFSSKIFQKYFLNNFMEKCREQNYY